MSELAPKDRKRPSATSVAIACIVLLLFTPAYSGEGPADVNLLEYALKIALCGAASAWLFRTVGWMLGSLSAIPAALLAYYLGGSVYFVVIALLYLPLGAALALVSKDKLTRSAAIAIGAGIGTVLLLSLLLIPTYFDSGTVSFSALESRYSPFFTFLKDNIKKSFVISVLGNDVSFVTDENAAYYTKQVLCMIPTLLGVAFVVIGYLSSLLYKQVLKWSRCDLPDPGRWNIDPAPISAAFLILAVLILSIDIGLPLQWQIGLASPGLFVLPTFCMVGFSSAFAIRIVDGLPRPRILRPVLLFFVGMSVGFLGLVGLSAAFGVFDCFRSAFPRKTA